MKTRSILPFVCLAFAVATVRAESPPADAAAIAHAVEQLRHVQGDWLVTTRFLNPDGSIAKSAEGDYRFRWVVPDRVLVGESQIAELKQSSAILFFIQESKGLITMCSVGADGHLWVMSGPADEEIRTTPPTPMSDGSTMQLRFTRFDVEAARFESRMEYTTDGGKTWTPGNHQSFRRRT